MGILDRIDSAAQGKPERNSIDTWIQDYLIPSQHFAFGGNVYNYGGQLRTTYQAGKIQEITNTLPGYSQAIRGCPPAFASQMIRALVLSQARFIFRSMRSTESRKIFGTRELELLEKPWPGGTTADLIANMEWQAGLAGTAYVYKRMDPRLRKFQLKVLRSDWVGIVYGSELEQESTSGFAPDAKIVAFVYQEGGIRADNKNEVYVFLPDEVAHWSPIPHPEYPEIGQSWLTPALLEISGDRAATEHKLQFFRNGATPNLVVSGIPAEDETKFQKIVDAMEESHAGIANAYKTLYLVAGADAKVVGSDLKSMDFTAVIGRGETRISILSRVPAAILGISEGLQGSTLNQGNFGMARRMFADTWVYPTLQGLAASLSKLLSLPPDAELWFDVRDIPLLREDAKDAALIQEIFAATISSYIAAGWTPESAKAATIAQDPSLLVHTGLVSVQLWEPGAQPGDAGSTKTDGGSPTEPSGQEGKSPGQPKDKTGQAPGKKKEKKSSRALEEARREFREEE